MLSVHVRTLIPKLEGFLNLNKRESINFCYCLNVSRVEYGNVEAQKLKLKRACTSTKMLFSDVGKTPNLNVILKAQLREIVANTNRSLFLRISDTKFLNHGEQFRGFVFFAFAHSDARINFKRQF